MYRAFVVTLDSCVGEFVDAVAIVRRLPLFIFNPSNSVKFFLLPELQS